MNVSSLNSEIMNQEILDLIEHSKNCIAKKVDPDLETTLGKMDRRVRKSMEYKKNSGDQISLMYLKLVKKVINKFYTANDLLKKISSTDTYFEEIDTAYELDILMGNLQNIINVDPKELSIENLQADIKKIEDLEDQKKRILMTYLMSDWKNLESVLLVMKLGETYKDIADELYNISILVN